jgi:hypothetical protein
VATPPISVMNSALPFDHLVGEREQRMCSGADRSPADQVGHFVQWIVADNTIVCDYPAADRYLPKCG